MRKIESKRNGRSFSKFSPFSLDQMCDWGQHISSFVFMFGSVRFSSAQLDSVCRGEHFVFLFILKLFHFPQNFLFLFIRTRSLSLSMSLCLLISMQSFKLYYFCFIIYGKINVGSVGKSQFCYFVVCFHFSVLFSFFLSRTRMKTHSEFERVNERRERRKKNRDAVRMLRNDWQIYTL